MGETKIIDGVIPTFMRVVTWNIWWRFGAWEQRQRAIIETLKGLDADVICLQEVWGDADSNQAEILAQELGYSHVFAPAMTMNRLEFGNAILSRWPIVESQMTELSGRDETLEGRCVVGAEIDGPRGRFAVFCTHLNYRYEQSHIRQQQVADLAHFVAEHGSKAYPPILCGDFNAVPESDEIRMLTGLTTCPEPGLFFHDAWQAAGPAEPGYTWDNTNAHAAQEYEPNRRIDYVFVGAPKRRTAGHIVDCRIVGDTPVNDTYPSDHYAVMAKLRY